MLIVAPSLAANTVDKKGVRKREDERLYFPAQLSHQLNLTFHVQRRTHQGPTKIKTNLFVTERPLSLHNNEARPTPGKPKSEKPQWQWLLLCCEFFFVCDVCVCVWLCAVNRNPIFSPSSGGWGVITTRKERERERARWKSSTRSTARRRAGRPPRCPLSSRTSI